MSEELGLKTKKIEDFSEWYLEVIEKAEIVDTRYGVKGFQIFLPLGMSAMENIVRIFEEELQERDYKQVLFPTVIPESYFKKESKHIKGFEQEVFWITHAGKNKLEERLSLRPTSETAMYPMFALWLRSYSQLPFKIYQKGTVFRYDTKMTKPLLRGREYYWIEAHTAHKSFEDAENQTKEDYEIFKEVLNHFALPFLTLRRPDWDKFPGADVTYAFDTVLPDGKIIQIGTTHNLGENFSKVFKVRYLDAKGRKKFVSQTSYGPGIMRILGTLISIHGDNKGVIFSPNIAPIQIVIVPIYTKETKPTVLEKCGEVLGRLEEEGFRVHLDDRDFYSPGFKFNEWELKGVPLRIEIGPKDIEKRQVSMVRRDFLERFSVSDQMLEQQVVETLDSINYQLGKRAIDILSVTDAKNFNDVKDALKKGGFVRIDFCMRESCAKNLKNATGADIKGVLMEGGEKAKGNCAICNLKAKEKVYLGKSY